MKNGIIFSGQGKEKGGEKNLYKDFNGVRTRKRIVRGDRRNDMVLTQCLRKKQSILMSAILLPGQFDFEVSSVYTGPEVRWLLLHL